MSIVSCTCRWGIMCTFQRSARTLSCAESVQCASAVILMQKECILHWLWSHVPITWIASVNHVSSVDFKFGFCPHVHEQLARYLKFSHRRCSRISLLSFVFFSLSCFDHLRRSEPCRGNSIRHLHRRTTLWLHVKPLERHPAAETPPRLQRHNIFSTASITSCPCAGVHCYCCCRNRQQEGSPGNAERRFGCEDKRTVKFAFWCKCQYDEEGVANSKGRRVSVRARSL